MDTLNGFLETIGDLGQSAADIYKTATADNRPVVSPAVQRANAQNWQKWIPAAVGGIVLVVVLALVFRRK